MGDDLAAAVAAADRALSIADADPHAALALVGPDVVQELLDHECTGAAARGSWARGLALRKLGGRREALDALVRARTLLLRIGQPMDAHRVAIPLAFEHLVQGHVGQAVAELEAAAAALDGLEGARATEQLALVLHRAGRDADTMDAWDRAVSAFRAAGSAPDEAKALFNRAVVHTERGEFDAAEADMAAGERIYVALGDEIHLADLAHNRGYVAARRRDLGTALRWFDDSQRRMTELGMQKPELLLDRADTLADAGLVGEARAVIEAAIRILEDRGQQTDLAEACLSAARACLALGQLPDGAAWARRAREGFTTQERPRWVPVAAYYETMSRPAGSPDRRARELLELGDTLRAAGWRSTADEADSEAVTLLAGTGCPDEAEAPLARLRRLRRDAPDLDRLRYWLAETEVRLARGRHLAAARSMDAAVRALASHQAGVGSMELRAHGAGQAERAMALAALLGGVTSPRPALEWVERIRSAQEPQAVAPAPGIAGDLEELRRVTTRLRVEPLRPGDERRLRAQQVALEELVRRQARHTPVRAQGRPVPHRELLDELGGRLLVEYVSVKDRLWALTLQDGVYRSTDLGPSVDIRRAVAALRMTLGGVVIGRANATADQPGRSGDTDQLDSRLAGLAELLVASLTAPLTADLGSAPSRSEVVVVPSGVVASVPWAALPGLGDRPVVVAPSGSTWAGAMARRRRADASGGPGSVVIVVGPGLRYAHQEAEAVAGVWGSRARILPAEDATIAAVVECLAEADLIHFATHGSFRSDSPLLSSLQLADGALTGYDLARLERVPPTLVLSGCETGMSDSGTDAALGLCGLLLGSGAASVVASVSPIADIAAARLTVPFHAALGAGSAPALALAAARSEVGRSDPSSLGFCCFGAG